MSRHPYLPPPTPNSKPNPFICAAVLFPSAAHSSWVCILQMLVGQGVALLSCCYNFLVCLALQFVFAKFSSTPLGDIEKIVSVRNQFFLWLFCAVRARSVTRERAHQTLTLGAGAHGHSDGDRQLRRD